MRTTVHDVPVPSRLSNRDIRLLRAAADGRVECSGNGHLDFFVDGFAYCDHQAARALVRAGLLRPAESSDPAERRTVRVTDAGRDALAGRDR
ncbi:MAG TPA: hypothetical protein VKZ81_12115 [Pseudonocardia sp.]|uniref:hypothetical protein n=1 Tax=Pseudonocardia sp. TaxID=60912 RepID=UPI002B4B7D20|nr:hypothetical protein [Pseudonocardia sp.]HLU56199.1 hypothetical protein [Pseudonocardia sp.]